MWEEMRAARDPDKQAALIKEMAVYLQSQAVQIAAPASCTANFWWPWIKNYYGEANNGYAYRSYVYARLWIDQDLKREMGY